MAPREGSGQPPRGTEISERLFNVLNNETYHLQAQANGNEHQSMADATGYLKVMK